MRLWIWLLLLALPGLGRAADNLVISEFLADNAGILEDEDGTSSGWIEISNPGSNPVALLNWALTDDPASLFKWRFPATNLAGGGFLVVFASEKNRALAGAPLHTNFKLDSHGGYLALVRPDGSMASQFSPAYPEQRQNTSYGVGYFESATPGTSNSASYPSYVRDTKFSQDRGYYETNFSLVITTATAGATIYYTTNGSAPDSTSGLAYSAPIRISRTTVVRAAAFAANALPSRGDSQAYLFLRDVLIQPNNPPGFPSIWGSVSADYAMDPRIVTNTLYAGAISNDLRSLPVLSLVLDKADIFGTNGIYSHSEAAGDLWERPVSIEYFDPNDPARQFHINGGVQILGSSQRTPAVRKHGFRVNFKADYGPNKLRFPLYPDTSVAQFKNLSFFPGGHDGCAFNTDVPQYASWPYGQATFARARWLFQSQLDAGQPGVHGDFVHLYINGLYWGHYRMNERPDASYAADHFGGDKLEYDAIKHASPVGSTGQPDQYEVADGTDAAWLAMYGLAAAGLASDAQFQAIQQYLDVNNFMDYLIINMVCGNLDWPDKNWYATRLRAPGAGFKFYPWDGEILLGMEDPSADRTGVNGANCPGFISWQLRANPEYRRMFGDHVQRHLFNGGAMTTAAMQARFASITNYMGPSIVPEAARWGDNSFFHQPPDTPVLYTPATHWQPECSRIMTNIIPLRWSLSLQQFRAAGLFPALDAPVLNQFGGPVPAGFNLALANPNASGVIFFTLDGADPRLYGSGGVAPSAQAFSLPVTLNATTLVRARVKNGTNWSALVEATFYAPQDFTKLLVTEIMYDPPAFGGVTGDEMEFLELKNTGPSALDLSGLVFTAGITFGFTNGTLLGPGQFFVLGRNRAQLQARYPGLVVNGTYTGKLNNGGETVTLSSPVGGNILSVTYNNAASWPVTPHGFGFSVVPRDLGSNADPDNGANWRASSSPGGSPGMDDPTPVIVPVVINEVLSAAVPPDVDAIELFNPSASDLDLGGWFLSDDPALPTKFRIPDQTWIPALGFRVFTETNFNPSPGTNHSFALNSRGESVYLFSGDGAAHLTGYSHGFSFGAAAPGVTFGRYVVSTGEEEFPAQRASSLGAANAGPRVGPVVINEIHYHPEVGGDPFVELKNLTSDPVFLFDPSFPTNTWRLNGLAFDFPTNQVLAPNQFLLLVATNPAAFRAKYSVPGNVPILGPWSGRLQPSGERLELQRPDVPDTNGVAYITVDEVRYNDKAPWSPAADGGGPSLQRQNPAAYGNDPTNWVAALPTPSADYLAGLRPQIASQPADLTVVAGQTATFLVIAAGPALNYQWRLDGHPLDNATNPALLLTHVQPAQSGTYSVVVFNSSGSVLSSNATLTVLVPAAITQQPQSTNVLQGSNVVFRVAASSSTPITYQWQFFGTNLPGALAPTHLITNVQPAQAGPYTVVLTDAVGSITSQVATLTILGPPVILEQPQSQTAVQYATVTMRVVATGTPPLAYRWRRNGFTVTGQTNATLLLTNVQPASAGSYAVFITNPAVGSSGIGSVTAVLTVLTDADHDGLPDVWMMQYFGHTNSLASDHSRPQDDPDGDGATNQDEYIAGTHPRDPSSCLRIDRITKAGGVTLTFLAVSNHTYTVQFTDPLTPAVWQNWTRFPAVSTNNLQSVVDPTALTNRFYRLVTPWQP